MTDGHELPATTSTADSDPKQRHPPLVLPASAASASARSRSASCSARRRPRPPPAGRPARRRSRRTSRPRPSASSSCSWPARRATSSCSTTSRELAKCDGKLPPAELLKGYRAAFINPNSQAARAEVQVRQARPVRRGAVASCCRTSATVVDDIAIVKSMAHRRLQPRARPDLDEHRLASSSAGRAWARG